MLARWAAISSLVWVLACSGPGGQSGFTALEVLDGQGNTRSSVDFGRVQVMLPAQLALRARNSGSRALTLTSASVSNPKFVLVSELPVELGPGAETALLLTFTPTVLELRETGQLTLSTDDPRNPSAEVALSGSGIAAVLVVTPPALSFGEVQVGEPKSLEVQVLNAGSTALVLPSVMVTPASPSLTGTAFALQRSYEPGAQATATVVFTPSAAAPLSAVLDLGRVQVPVTGQGVQALPRLCVRLDDQAERCTEPAVDSLLVDFGSVCERDGGACSSSDGGVGRLESTARFSVRNEGNTSVSYSLRYESWLGERCDAGSQLDFAFSNSAGDGVKWSEPTTALPLQRGDPKPWQTAPVSVTYRPTSSCAGDTIDRARVTWLRQGDPTGARLPAMLTVNFVGRSE